jgi:hypothetical protein
VQQIKRRLTSDYSLVTDTPSMIDGAATSTPVSVIASHSPMKHFTVNLTSAVHDALVEACAITNRQSPEDPITIAEYTEDLIINRVVELGLLRKKVQMIDLAHKTVANRRTRPAWVANDKQLMEKCVGPDAMRRFKIAQMYWRQGMTAKDIAGYATLDMTANDC